MTKAPKKIPYAVANYEHIVDGNYHFVDKTRFIHELEKYVTPVFLRPRRFGKSLWCSILDCYYDINRTDRFDQLFGATDIGRNPSPLRNSYLTLRFDFSKISVKASIGDIQTSFDEECLNTIDLFISRYQKYVSGLTLPRSGDAAAMLARLLQTVEKNHAPPIHIIIDEYDNFTNQLLTARQDHLYSELTTGDSFLRTFYKVIKAGVGEGSIARVFITGVLPVTMDDLTSGFNIAQIITLKEHVLDMLGFTQSEVNRYVDEIFADHSWDNRLKERVLEDLQVHYNGYSMLPGAHEAIYNATICNFYLNDLVISNGKIPVETIDDNLRVSVDWLRRLAGGESNARQLLEQLMLAGSIPVDMAMLSSQFSMNRFFTPEFLPISLYYLGMVTFLDHFSVGFPNLCTKRIFTGYFNELEHIDVSRGYGDMFQRFMDDGDLAALFEGYWQRYVGQIPAQAFDKANENFFRTTFYELCARYLSFALSFAIEVNRPSGRSDWEAVGRAGSKFDNIAYLVEFKHFSRKKAAQSDIMGLKSARDEEIRQVDGYAADIHQQRPELKIRRHVVYTIAGAGYRFFTLE